MEFGSVMVPCFCLLGIGVADDHVASTAEGEGFRIFSKLQGLEGLCVAGGRMLGGLQST